MEFIILLILEKTCEALLEVVMTKLVDWLLNQRNQAKERCLRQAKPSHSMADTEVNANLPQLPFEGEDIH